MAAPITHIVLAEKVLKNMLSMSRKEFLIGTSFPDIRYIRVIDREKTHVRELAMDEIASQPSFKAGFLLHSLVDKLQVEYHRKHENKFAPENGLVLQAFKLFEDKVLYEKVPDWDVVAGYLTDILPEEIELVSKESIEKWHSILKEYMSQSPSPESRKPFFKELFFTEEQTQKIEAYIKEMEADSDIVEYIQGFYQEIL